jgi:hypothetical protein
MQKWDKAENEKKIINFLKYKNKIEEKVDEWEMKGHACWPSPYPLVLYVSSFTVILKGSFSQERKMYREP